MKKRMESRHHAWEQARAYFVYPSPGGSGWRTELGAFVVDSLNEETDIGLLTLNEDVRSGMIAGIYANG
jgi:hypothetical protein